MKKEMLINVLQPEECRIAIVEGGVLEELYVERASQESYVNNIYKGRIVNIEPSIQAAFIDFGIGRNGFLHVSDVDPVYYKHLLEAKKREGGERRDDRGDRGERPRRDDRGDRSGRRPFEPVEIPSADVVPPEFQDDNDEEIVDEIAEEIAPENEGGFGSGIDLESTPPPVPPRREPRPEPRPQPRPEPRPEPRVQHQPPPRPAPVETVRDEDEDDLYSSFGAGIVDEDPAPRTAPVSSRNRDRDEPSAEKTEERAASGVTETIPTPREVEPTQDESPATSSEETGEEAPKKKRTTRKKPAAAEGEEAKPKKKRTTKKKTTAEGEEPPTEEGTPSTEPTTDENEPPQYMPSAERRTSDDEPELGGDSSPDGGFVFDPFAPNDRFVEGNSGSSKPSRPAVEEEEDDEDLDEEEGSGGNFEEDDSYDGGDEDEDEAPNQSRGRGGRDGDRDRGRGGRDGDRGRGGRGGDRDRGRGGDRGGRRSFGRDGRDAAPKPPIQEIFKRGQEVIVQVIKEGVGTKGPTLSTYISIAGRYLVLMPSLNRLAVSRKIMDEGARGKLKENLAGLEPPKGIGFIIRTAAIDRNKEELQRDLAYLVRLWEVFTRRVKKMASPVEIYRESDMITRTIRDNFTSDIDTIWVDEEQSYNQAAEFLNIVMPRYASRIKHFAETEPIFHKFKIEDEIRKIQEKKVPLPMGGSIVIEQTEALVAIDVNSGNFRAENNAEETAYQMNLQAAKEIGRQLRLRDLGGVIVNDFIDMKDERHRRNVENALRDALRRDRARTKILRTSAFGVIEMTRQRIRPSLKRSTNSECSHCRGTGSVKTAESMSIEIIRAIQFAACKQTVRRMELKVHFDVAHYLLNKKRREITQWEDAGKMQVFVTGQIGISPESLDIHCFDQNGTEIRISGSEPPAVRAVSDRREDDRRGGRDEERRGGRDEERRGSRDDDRRGGRGGRNNNRGGGGGRGRGDRGRRD